MTFLALFWSFLKIGIFGFGGGYAILALIENEVVDIHGWMTTTEFTDIVAISQATPGPIVINCATYVGYTATDSIIGSAIATFAVCLPSLILASLAARFIYKFRDNKYVDAAFKGLRPAVVGLILAAGLTLINHDNFTDYISIIIFAIVAVCSYFKVNPIFLLMLSGIAGYFIY
ncbi:MAG: chromate transporter [Paludibacteraceae bacterium]|nr:chromate transporter [Paludibacteraceae bacterium]